MAKLAFSQGNRALFLHKMGHFWRFGTTRIRRDFRGCEHKLAHSFYLGDGAGAERWAEDGGGGASRGADGVLRHLEDNPHPQSKLSF